MKVVLNLFARKAWNTYKLQLDHWILTYFINLTWKNFKGKMGWVGFN